jgi:hypothetical protein
LQKEPWLPKGVSSVVPARAARWSGNSRTSTSESAWRQIPTATSTRSASCRLDSRARHLPSRSLLPGSCRPRPHLFLQRRRRHCSRNRSPLRRTPCRRPQQARPRQSCGLLRLLRRLGLRRRFLASPRPPWRTMPRHSPPRQVAAPGRPRPECRRRRASNGPRAAGSWRSVRASLSPRRHRRHHLRQRLTGSGRPTSFGQCPRRLCSSPRARANPAVRPRPAPLRAHTRPRLRRQLSRGSLARASRHAGSSRRRPCARCLPSAREKRSCGPANDLLGPRTSPRRSEPRRMESLRHSRRARSGRDDPIPCRSSPADPGTGPVWTPEPENVRFGPGLLPASP